jgi:hypothetical protein
VKVQRSDRIFIAVGDRRHPGYRRPHPGWAVVTNPGGLTSFLLGLTVKDRDDLLMKLAAAYPRLTARERDNAFAIVAREIRRVGPILAARSRDPENGPMITATILRHRALLKAMDPKGYLKMG